MPAKLKRSPTQAQHRQSVRLKSKGGSLHLSTGTAKRALRSHQLKMFKYCMQTKHPFLACEMRLGKNLVTIRRCLLYKPLDPVAGLKILIIAPNSALGAWEDELEQEACEYRTLSGNTQARRNVLRGVSSNFTLCNKEAFLYLPEICYAQNWDAVIWDETTWISNPRSKITRYFITRFRDCPHRWALCGLPNPESILQLFCQVAWLDGHAFGYRDFWRFRAQCFYQRGFDYAAKPGVENHIKDCFGRRACIIRRKDEGLEPVKAEIVRTLELQPKDRLAYNKAEQDFEHPDGKTTMWSVVKYHWLRGLCSKVKPAELLWLLQNDLKDIPVVVWFHYNHEIDTVSKLLTHARISNGQATGKTTREGREALRKQWQAGIFNVLLLQQAIAQEGMDLSHSDTAVYYSETPSSKATRQTKDRIVSLSKNKSLLYVYLVVKDSVDSDLHTALAAKKLRSDLDLSKALRLGILSRAKPTAAKHQ